MFIRPGLLAAALAAGATFAVPATAQAGFFEQLFGIAPQPAPYQGGQSSDAPSRQAAPRHVYRHVKKRVVEAKTGRQQPTDLFHDASLRPGDAVMMKGGIHVFEGDAGSSHEGGDFVALVASNDVSGKQRAALAALDTTRNDPLRDGHAAQPDTLASGRSAAVGAPVNAGYKITDARGASVRYVGP